jgi:DnaJ family protein A protein 2
MSTLYDRLAVQKTASADEIKKAYREMARQHHPDKGGDTEKFKGIQEAYEVLSDEGRRQKYDMTGSTSEQPQRPPQQPFPDIFSMFAGMHRNNSRSAAVRKERGPDSCSDIGLGLDAFYNGLEMNLTFKRKRKCVDCKDKTMQCSACGGAGMCLVKHQIGHMIIQSHERCNPCTGSGKTHVSSCSTCNGERFVETDKTITTNIRPGTPNGESVTFPGECSESSEYDTPGDLVLRFRVTPSRYEWKGDDLLLDHTISFAESILGFQVTLDDHPSRKQQVLTWCGGPVIHGTVLAMEGKGMPRKNGAGTGDLKLKLTVTQPPLVPWTAEQRTALKSVFMSSE